MVEGLAFQIGISYERVTAVLRQDSGTTVLSGNAFKTLEPSAILAAIVPAQIIEPLSPGLATLRAAARCGFQALGPDTGGHRSRIAAARIIDPNPDTRLNERYARFKAAYFDTQQVSN